MMPQYDKEIMGIALMFAEVHAGDSDSLGVASKNLELFINRMHPGIKRSCVYDD